MLAGTHCQLQSLLLQSAMAGRRNGMLSPIGFVKHSCPTDVCPQPPFFCSIQVHLPPFFTCNFDLLAQWQCCFQEAAASSMPAGLQGDT